MEEIVVKGREGHLSLHDRLHQGLHEETDRDRGDCLEQVAEVFEVMLSDQVRIETFDHCEDQRLVDYGS